MAQRITAKDIHPVAQRVAVQLRELGELREGDLLDLQEGSKVNGRSWRLYVLRAGESGRRTLPFLTAGWPGGGLLGDTAREAYATLHTISAMLDYALDKLREQGPVAGDLDRWTVKDGPVCGAESPQGNRCHRAPGHVGSHAQDQVGRIVAVWN